MKSIIIKGSQRESVGKVATKALRNAEKVPCVLYGGDGVMHFSAEEKSFAKLVYTSEIHTVVIEVGSEKYNAILQDIQFHPVTDKILHIDFYQLHDDKEVIMGIPVKIVGTSIGVLRGGVLRRNMRTLRVKALPANLPDFINADISKLKIGNKLYVTELTNPNYTIMHPDNTVVTQVRTARTVISEDEDNDEAEESASETTEGAEENQG